MAPAAVCCASICPATALAPPLGRKPMRSCWRRCGGDWPPPASILRNCAISGKGLGRQVAELINGDRSALEAQPMQVPDIAPRWDGGHLSAAWHFSRFRSQYQPWFQRGSGARLAVPLPSAEALQQKTFDVLRTGQETLALTLPFSCDS